MDSQWARQINRVTLKIFEDVTVIGVLLVWVRSVKKKKENKKSHQKVSDYSGSGMECETINEMIQTTSASIKFLVTSVWNLKGQGQFKR